jgi:steroid delta-isomerase-like uncharacterized protein
MASVVAADQMGERVGVRGAYERYVRTFGTKRVDEIVKLHADDGIFWLHTGREAVRGRPAIEAAFQGFFDAWPEFGFEIYRTMFTESAWILDWAVTAVLKGADGAPRKIKFHALDIVDVDDDGQVARKETFIDLAQVKAALEG